MIDTKKEFWELVRLLVDNGYTLSVEKNDFGGGLECVSTAENYESRKGVTFIFYERGTLGNRFDAMISADNISSFDKWNNAPLCLPFPANNRQRDFLLDKFKYLGTEEAYHLSNKFELKIISYE